MSEQLTKGDYDEDNFNQCPHEVGRATCTDCNCPCSGCDRWRARDAARMSHSPHGPDDPRYKPAAIEGGSDA